MFRANTQRETDIENKKEKEYDVPSTSQPTDAEGTRVRTSTSPPNEDAPSVLPSANQENQR